MTETERMDNLCEKMKVFAIEISQQDPFGGLHIFIDDGNCDAEALEFCYERATLAEREFLNRIRWELSEEAIFGAWALAQLTDNRR